MSVSLKFQCPDCGRKLRAVEKMFEATQVVKRTCKCSKKWQINIRPVQGSKPGVFLDVATFTAL